MNNEKLYITIKTDTEDFMAFQNLVPSRIKRMAEACTELGESNPVVNRLADRLHPKVQHLRVDSIRQATPSMKVLRLVPDGDTKELAFFRPGQYLSLDLTVKGSRISRPYSIASSPKESLGGYYELGIKNNDQGFAVKYLYEQVQPGVRIDTSGPCGNFYYEPIRDREALIGIAGGSGITPFRSMAKSIADGTISASMTLFYGCNTEEDIAFRKEFLDLQQQSKGRFKVVFVLAQEEKPGFEHGFITSDLLRKYADPFNTTLFICGPQNLYRFIAKELEPLQLRRKFVRFELFGETKQVEKEDGYPAQTAGKAYQLTVHQGPVTTVIPARTDETLVNAMERAGIRPPTKCRSGSCGFCRSQLVQGEVYVSKQEDGRRYGDREFGFIHPCSSFPLSDCELIVPPTKI